MGVEAYQAHSTIYGNIGGILNAKVDFYFEVMGWRRAQQLNTNLGVLTSMGLLAPATYVMATHGMWHAGLVGKRHVSMLVRYVIVQSVKQTPHAHMSVNYTHHTPHRFQLMRFWT